MSVAMPLNVSRAERDTVSGVPLDVDRVAVFGEFGRADADAGVVSIDTAALKVALRDAEADRRRVAARQFWLLGEAEVEGVWRDAGHASMAGWVRANFGWSEGELSDRLLVARVGREFPVIVESISTGELPVNHATVLCRAIKKYRRRCDEWSFDQLNGDVSRLIRCARREYTTFRELVEAWADISEPEQAAELADAQYAARTATSKVRRDGMFEFRVVLDPVAGAEFTEIWAHQVDALFRSEWADAETVHGDDTHPGQLQRTQWQRQADAVIELFRRGATHTRPAGAPDPGVLILVDETTFTSELTRQLIVGHQPSSDAFDGQMHLSRRVCRTANGTPVAPAVALEAIIAGWFRFVMVNALNEPLAISSKQRCFTGPIRDTILAMSSRCIHPGCRRRSGACQVDHRIEHANGGPTALANANPGPYCGRNNRFKSITGIAPVQVEPSIWELRDRNGHLVS